MHQHISTDTPKSGLHPLLFLAAIIVAVVSLRTAIDTLDIIDLPNRLQDFITITLSIFIEAFPFLVLGSLLAGVVNTYIPTHTIQKFLPKNAILRRAMISTIGFMFPVCECGNVPLSRSLMIQGLKPSEAITFLLSAPVLNPVTIWSTWADFIFDSSIVVSRVAATILIANIVGFILSLKKNEQDFLTDEFQAVCNADPEPEQKKDRFRASKFSRGFSHEAFIMLRMLAIGALIAGSIQSFIPRDVLVSIGSDVLLSILAMLILAFVVSICANVDAFFALSFASTFTAGSIVSFLVFGPMIDIKILLLLKTTFKTHLLVIVSVLTFLMAALTGLVVSYAF